MHARVSMGSRPSCGLLLFPTARLAPPPPGPSQKTLQVLYNFKSMGVVPTAKDFIDIVLSKTQRGTPTVVHNGACAAAALAAPVAGMPGLGRLTLPSLNAPGRLGHPAHPAVLHAQGAPRGRRLRRSAVAGAACQRSGAPPAPPQPPPAPSQVKFTAQNWNEKLGKILEDFPKARGRVPRPRPSPPAARDILPPSAAAALGWGGLCTCATELRPPHAASSEGRHRARS